MRDLKRSLVASSVRQATSAKPAARLGAAALMLIVGAGPLLAAPPEVSDKSDPNFHQGAPVKHEWTADQQAQIGASTLFLAGAPSGSEVFGELASLSAGEYDRYWTFFDPDVIRAIPPTALAAVRDRTRMTQEIADPEQDAFFYMLIFANRTSPAALDKTGRDNKGADWAHIFRDPAQYRGEIVHFEGVLKKLRQFPPQPMALQGGVKKYYEGFMYADILQQDPVFFDITELPKGLEPGEHLNVRIGLSGYFFKIFRYTAVDTKQTNKDRLAPLVIGHTIALLKESTAAAPPPDSEWVKWLGPAFLAVIGLTVAILFAVGYWYRRSDWRVRGRLSAVRHTNFIPPSPETPPPTEGEPRNRLFPGPTDYPASEN